MVGGVGLGLDDGQQLGERGARLLGVQPVGRHALQLDLGDDAERAEPDPGRGEHLRLDLGRALERRPVGEHQGEPADGRGDALAPGAGAVGARGDRAADRLAVDVTEVGQRQPERLQRRVEHVQRGAGEHAHPAPLPVDPDHAAQPVDVQQQAVGRDERGERVARPGHPDPQPARRGPPHGIRDPVRPTRRAAPPPGSHSRCRPQLRHSLTRSSFLHRGTTEPCRRARPRPPGARASNRSSSSPALAPRIHTRSPIRRPSASSPCSGVCTSPVASVRTSDSPRRTGDGTRDHPGSPLDDVAAAEGGDVAPGRAAARPGGRTPSPGAGSKSS